MESLSITESQTITSNEDQSSSIVTTTKTSAHLDSVGIMSVDIENEPVTHAPTLTSSHNVTESDKELLLETTKTEPAHYTDLLKLLAAVCNGDKETVQQLLLQGLDPNMLIFDESLLHTAVERHHTEVVDILLQHGTDPNVLDKRGDTVLHSLIDSLKFCQHDKSPYYVKDTIKTLLENGVDPNIANKSGRTPLNLVMEIKNSGSRISIEYNILMEIIHLLERHTTSSGLRIVDSQLHIALREQQHNDIVMKLLQHEENLNLIDKDGMAPIHIAADRGNSTVVHALLDNGARADLVDNSNRTLLHFAAGGGCIDIVELLIKQGTIDINALDKDGMAPIHIAADRGNSTVVKALLRNGARADLVDNSNRTLLHFAAGGGCTDIVELLIKQGTIDINALDKSNRTPLFNAIERGKTEVVYIFLTNGAKADIVDNNSNSVLHLTVGYEAMKNYAMEYRMEYETKYGMEYDMERMISMYRFMKQKKLITFKQVEMIKQLINKGVNLNIINKRGHTVFHVLFESLQIYQLNIQEYVKDITEVLLEGGADPNITDEFDRTPLDLALEIKRRSSIESIILTEIIHLLERHTTSSGQRSSKETTPFLP